MTADGDTTRPPQAQPPAQPEPQDRPEQAVPAAGPPEGQAASPEVTPGEGQKLEELFDAIEGEEESDKGLRFVDSFGLVLILLVTTYFVTAIGGDATWGRVASLVLLAATTWLALRASHVERLLLRWAVALIPVATAVAVVATLLGSAETGRGVAAALTVLLVLVAPVAIVKRLATHPIVSMNTFYGAVCIYLLLAMFFASVYSLTGWVQGGPFFAQIQPPAAAGTIDYLYFSFITITTVGYGDLTAASNVGRMTAACEAVLGQLYLITVVALVVQNLGQARHFKSIRDRLKRQ